MEYYKNLPQIPQRSPEWYSKKTQILTSTQISSVLHLNSHHSYAELLKNQLDITSKNEPMILTSKNIQEIDPLTWGTILEPIAIQHLEQTTQKPVGILGLKIHDTISYLGASPDGVQIVNSKPRLIEIKCPKKRQITYRVPIEYWVQVQIGMEVWNVDEALYCEYKFDITNESPTTTDLTVTYGQLSKGIYWMYQDSWTYLIHRDREWFNRVRPQIEKFYHLKFDKAFQLQVLDNKKKPKTKKISNQIKQIKDKQIKDKKRKRNYNETNDEENEDYDDEFINKKQKSEKDIVCSKYTIHNRIPINKFSNFLRDDPIIDWLDVHGIAHGYEREKSLFLDYYNQQNLTFKLSKIQELIKLAKEQHVSYQVLNPSIDNLLEIYKNNLLLKLPYDINLLEETQLAMDNNVQMIFMGQIGKEIKEDIYLWDTFDVIIHRDAFEIIFPEHEFIEAGYLECDELKDMKYIPIKIKLTTLEFLKNSFNLRSKHKVDQLKIGAITTAILMDKYDSMGLIPVHENIKLIKEGLKWLESIDDVDMDEIYPNMKNHYDSQWAKAKSDIAEKKEELTQINYLTIESREYLHSKGIYKISQLNEEMVKKLKYSGRILPFIKNKLYLPPLIGLPKSDVEVYLDFENCSSLGGQSIIFLMGILVKYQNKEPEYLPYLVKNLNKQSENEMLKTGLTFLESLGKNVPVFHWSRAEPNLLKGAGYTIPSNCYLVDLYQHFLNNQASIPGCYSYGLKDVAGCLFKHKKIQSQWLNGLDGTTAMTMAWNINHKCEITGEDFNKDPRIRKLCDYNYVDCIVLEEIKKLITLSH